jgi:S1 RNA binding domain protein
VEATASHRFSGPGADVVFGKPQVAGQSFEDMLNRFKQSSDDRMTDLRRNIDGKRGTSGKRGHNK